MATENKELSVPEEQVNATRIEDTMSASTASANEESKKETPTVESVKDPETVEEPVVDFSDEAIVYLDFLRPLAVLVYLWRVNEDFLNHGI